MKQFVLNNLPSIVSAIAILISTFMSIAVVNLNDKRAKKRDIENMSDKFKLDILMSGIDKLSELKNSVRFTYVSLHSFCISIDPENIKESRIEHRDCIFEMNKEAQKIEDFGKLFKTLYPKDVFEDINDKVTKFHKAVNEITKEQANSDKLREFNAEKGMAVLAKEAEVIDMIDKQINIINMKIRGLTS